MPKKESFTKNLLTIEILKAGGSIKVKWSGKSIDRVPAKFITPILIDIHKDGSGQSKPIILDFQDLEYMNSSTITPIIKILERAKKGKTKITVLYDKSLKWQDLSFSALEIFQTKDKRAQIKGLN
jgi:hypothetical protein